MDWLKARGPVGEAATFGRYARLPRMTMLWSWLGKAAPAKAGATDWKAMVIRAAGV